MLLNGGFQKHFRFAIMSKGLEKVMLSAQHLLSCDRRGQQSCNGGYLDRAWNYIRKFGYYSYSIIKF